MIEPFRPFSLRLSLSLSRTIGILFSPESSSLHFDIVDAKSCKLTPLTVASVIF